MTMRSLALALLLALPLSATASELPLLAPTTDGPLPSTSTFFDGAENVPRPQDVLGYSLGARFTPHHRMVEVLERLAASSERLRLWEYGRSVEGRPLQLLAVSSPRHLERLDTLRQSNLQLAHGSELSAEERQRLLAEQPAFAWLAFGVHGNETSSTEAGLALAYTLATAGEPWTSHLENLVVLIDPLSNPDGRERYVSWYRSERGQTPDADPNSREHFEPWPGGRQNHYLFDLNRDWAWLSQAETRQRMVEYQRWEPQLYVDFHEMSRESLYFFPPAADPILETFDPRQLQWLEVFGEANAKAFDERGWLYYVRQVFDLFYPGYGDTYPTLRGAVGMTYEVGGGGSAGLSVRLQRGGTLTLADRVARHYTTALATLETAATHRQALLEDFLANRAPEASPTTWLWSAEAPEAADLTALLEAHGLTVNRLASGQRLDVRPLGIEDTTVEHSFPAHTFTASTAQPLGRLLRSLMATDLEVPADFVAAQRERRESGRQAQFYDITSWSLPLAYGVEAWRFEGELPTDALSSAIVPEPISSMEGDPAVGWLLPPQGLAGYQLIASLLRQNARLHLATEPFELDGQRFDAGTLFLPRRLQSPALKADLPRLATEAGARLYGAPSALTTSGPSLGSNDLISLRHPRIGLLGGPGVSPTSHGFTWHLLDETLGLQHSRLPIERLASLGLDAFDVLILPSGNYGDLPESSSRRLAQWVRGGGTLVAIGGAVDWVRDQGLSTVELRQVDDKDGSQDPPLTPGAILATQLTPGHPLGAGLHNPPVLFFGRQVLQPTGDPRRDVLTARSESPRLAGFAWPEAQELLPGALLVAAESAERGTVVLFAQDPAYRHFWRSTMPLLLNAVLYGPSLDLGGG